MKTLLAASAIVLASVTGSIAASTALDVNQTETNANAAVQVGMSSVDNQYVTRQRLGDGSPMYWNDAIDYAPTASIGVKDTDMRARLGDASPMY